MFFTGEIQEIHTQNNKVALHKISLSQGESKSFIWRRVEEFVTVVIYLWGVTLLYWNCCYVAIYLWITGRSKNGINPLYHYFGIG